MLLNIDKNVLYAEERYFWHHLITYCSEIGHGECLWTHYSQMDGHSKEEEIFLLIINISASADGGPQSRVCAR